MSAEKLREAAAKMREDAKAAICPCGGPMCNVEKGWFHEGELRARFEDTPGDSVPHVLAWSPVVALRAADLLEMTADYIELALDSRHPGWRGAKFHAQAIADAYLGEQS